MTILSHQIVHADLLAATGPSHGFSLTHNHQYMDNSRVFSWVSSILTLSILIILFHDNFEPLESACKPASCHDWACSLIRKRKGRWINDQMK
jgi:hypothetical protein